MFASRVCAGFILVLCTLSLAACQTVGVDKSQIILDTLHQSAAEAETAGDYKTAVQQYQNLYARDPSNSYLRLGLSRNLRYSGAAKNAIKLLESAKPDSKFEMAHMIELGKAKLAAGHTDDAIEILNQAAQKNLKNWEVRSALGIAYDLGENYPAARDAYKAAMALSPQNPIILNNYALSVASSGDLDGAIKMLKNAPRLVRHNPQIRQNLAMLYGIKGDLKSAQALGRMDLDEDVVQKNLLIYSQLGRK